MSIVVACHNGYMCKHTHKCVSCHRIVWANCERQTIDAPHQMFFAMQRKDSADKQSELWVGMLKAACLRACGNATPTNEQMTQMPPTDPVRTCARSLVNILVRLAEAYETLETPDLAKCFTAGLGGMQLLQQVARLLLLFAHVYLFGKQNTITFVAK